MRLSGLAGLGVLVLAFQAVIACDDSDDRLSDSPTSGGEGASAGESSEPGDGGSFGVAGENHGGGGSDAGAGGTGEAGMAGMAQCTTDGDCDDLNPCTEDGCTEGKCEHTDNTADCDDLSSCTPGQDKCQDGVCRGTRDTNACPACNVPGNMIQNCDFSMGLMHWADAINFQGGGSTQMVVNGRNVIDISDGGEGIYSVQPRQEPLTIKQGMRYKLRMVAGASVERDIVMALTQAGEPYKVYSTGDHASGGFTLHLEEQMKLFEFEFMMVDPDDANVKLEIKMGGADGTPGIVYFDDVVVEELKCTDNPSCNDDNECTADVCEVATGICSWTPTTGACTDDGDVCTQDVCDAGACSHPAADNGTTCADDADPCTLDECQGGLCKHPFDDVACDCSTDAQCDDDNGCTDDDCNDGTCQNTNNTATCDDANACTSADVCSAGVCGGTNNTDPCDDNDVCTVPDACMAGACTGTNVCFDCTVGGNLLTNCDFSSGDTGWLPGFFNGATEPTGTQSVVDGRLVVNITNGGTEPWQVQPRQEGLVLEQGTYVVKFNAMASVARTMELSITQNGGAYKSYSDTQTFNLTTDMQLFTFDFTMADPPPSELVKFEIKLGGTVPNATVPNTVTFDNMFIGPKP